MNEYTIYCTDEQTKKALELGAPINTFGYGDLGDAEDKILKLNKQCVIERDNDNGIIVSFLPTAEQMISWLETHECFKSITFLNTALENEQNAWLGFVNFTDNDKYPIAVEPYSSRPEATLAVIDAALEYLTKNKK